MVEKLFKRVDYNTKVEFSINLPKVEQVDEDLVIISKPTPVPIPSDGVSLKKRD